ncbi:MAG: discoidin domain-containing protein [Mycobacteriaceae bacterium]|nr:discoidin domain-containing protein [Mycobacteriaceae bacterium]
MVSRLRSWVATPQLWFASMVAAVLVSSLVIAGDYRSHGVRLTDCPADDVSSFQQWAPSHTQVNASYERHPFVGNGYLGLRVPPRGAGYAATGQPTGWPLYTPRYDGAFVAGLYSQTVGVADGRDAVAAIPNWSGLNVGVGQQTYPADTNAAQITNFRQTLFYRCGLVRTALRWTTAQGQATDMVYEIVADQADHHVGAVHLILQPHWSGEMTITDLLDGAGARRITPAGGGRTATGIHVDFRTNGTDITGSLASTLRMPVPARQELSAVHELTVASSVRFPVRAGQRYEVTKYVGVQTSLTTAQPASAAFTAAERAAEAGWPALLARTAAAWRVLWQGDIEIPHQPDMQSWARGALYSLYSATNSQQNNSISPVGLTSDDYAGEIFWDAGIWMYPALLEFSPELARSIVEYRFKTLAAARANATRLGYRGAFYPWTSGRNGNIDECHSWKPNPHCITQIHLQGDVSLAEWQYYLATGSKADLRNWIWPVMMSLAQFWESRVTSNDDGTYSINNVAGPDEYSNGVNDGVYTNAVAALALRNAVRAAEILGQPFPAVWTQIADHLRMPFDRDRNVFAQYDGYAGQRIKQADAVLLLYPLNWPMSPDVASSMLDYYSERTDPDGPAMTDAVEAIDAARNGSPCATFTHLERAARPFVREPFGQFMEARGDKAGADDAAAGAPAFTFITAAGGFVQAIVNGLLGLRLAGDAVDVDPMLPPQLADGIKISGLHWQGRQFTADIGAQQTTFTLNQGPPLPLHAPGRAMNLRIGSPLSVATRRPDLIRTRDVALCKPVTATSSEPGRYAAAAVDGTDSTGWIPDGDAGSLTVDLEKPTQISEIIEHWSDPAQLVATLQISLDNRTWTPVDQDTPTGTAELPHHPVARYVRIQVRSMTSGLRPYLKQFEVMK